MAGWPLLVDGTPAPAIAGWLKKTKDSVGGMPIIVQRAYTLHAGKNGAVWTTAKVIYPEDDHNEFQVVEASHQTDRFKGKSAKEALKWFSEHGYEQSWARGVE